MVSDKSLKEDKKQKVSVYTVAISDEQMGKVYDLCVLRGFSKYDCPYSNFAFKGDSLTIVGYASGKLVVQGNNTEDFVKYDIEPNITQVPVFGYDEFLHPEWFEAHAGMDESGKGDLFGPLVTACVIAGGNVVKKWIQDGIRDSKMISCDSKIFSLEKIILESDCVTNVMCVGMKKYNELYHKFGSNMNILLGWMHSCSLQNALQKRPVEWGMLDQFSKKPIVQKFLKINDFDLRMQTKAESDPVVAAASILARAEYNRQIDILSKNAGFKINKGAGKITVEQANKILQLFGKESLQDYIKTHFATAPKG